MAEREHFKSAFVTIIRGCSQHCTYCIVPTTTGAEKSRPIDTILSEISGLSENNYKEITLLGQNVNAYHDLSKAPTRDFSRARPDFSPKIPAAGSGVSYTELLATVSRAFPEMRIRQMSPHPAQFSSELIDLIKNSPNIASQIHAPAQSGASEILEKMDRGYTREAYDGLINEIRREIPDVGLSSDFIAGFCGETEENHERSVDLIEKVGYDQAFLFAYSLRERTKAHRRYIDNVPNSTKLRRVKGSQILGFF
eukprot:TRINITY_DN773_c0_g1_i5.p1 TRINITY_DN773_c0_g1~~TRINITY_DN773_c0_g1_i5.p1  ORF type:complete len:283 (-),score=10.64 TRINITY_DN773_c0_g1_i5:8-766(-)